MEDNKIKELEEKIKFLEEKNKEIEKDKITSIDLIGHEMKKPLVEIQTYINLLSITDCEEERKEILGSIYSKINGALEFQEQILNVAKENFKSCNEKASVKNAIYKIIGDKYKISWQKGLGNMEEYFDWINSCILIATNDSFGLHLAIAMKKYVVAMFGPTNSSEAYLYNRGKTLTPENVQCDDFPCCLCKCKINESCMNHISPEHIFKEIDMAFHEGICKT